MCMSTLIYGAVGPGDTVSSNVGFMYGKPGRVSYSQVLNGEVCNDRGRGVAEISQNP